MAQTVKRETEIKEHIADLESAVEFMKKKKGKKSFINAFEKNIEILKWAIGQPSEYDEIYDKFQSNKKNDSIPDALGLSGQFLNITAKTKDGKPVRHVGLSGMFYKMLPNAGCPKEMVATAILAECKDLTQRGGIENVDDLDYFVDNPEVLSEEFKEIIHLKENGKLSDICQEALAEELEAGGN